MFYSRVLLYYKVYSFLCFSNLFKNHSFNFLSKRYSRIHWPWIRAWTYLICVGVSVGGLSLNPFLGLINNFGMSSVIQRQNIKLADLVLMAIADLNSMKLLASPSTIQQHLESKEWFLKCSVRTVESSARWYNSELTRTNSVNVKLSAKLSELSRESFKIVPKCVWPCMRRLIRTCNAFNLTTKNWIKSVLYFIY